MYSSSILGSSLSRLPMLIKWLAEYHNPGFMSEHCSQLGSDLPCALQWVLLFASVFWPNKGYVLHDTFLILILHGSEQLPSRFRVQQCRYFGWAYLILNCISNSTVDHWIIMWGYGYWHPWAVKNSGIIFDFTLLPQFN